MTDDDLLARLPVEVREALARAIALRDTSPGESMQHAGRALAAAGVPASTPSGAVHPLASSYDEVPRAALAYSAMHGLAVWPFACPSQGGTRRRWMGLEPPGVLESCVVDVVRDGERTREPLWRALQIAGSMPAQVAVIDALPLDVALRAIGELCGPGAGYRVPAHLFFQAGTLRLMRDLAGEGRAWAIEEADRLAADPSGARAAVKPWVFLALVRARVPIEPRWDAIFPGAGGVKKEMLLEWAAAIPDDRRAAVIGPRLASTPWALELVAAHPSATMARALLAGAEPHSDRWRHLVAQLRAIGAAHAELVAAVDAIVAATPPPIELRVLAARRPESAAELTALEREQLRIGARGWDQQDLSAEARLAVDGSETSVRGSLEVRSIGDRDGTPLYDALQYAGDAGVVFRAGTTEEIAWLSQGGVVMKERDDALRVALQTALGPSAPGLEAKKKSAKKQSAKKATPTKKRR